VSLPPETRELEWPTSVGHSHSGLKFLLPHLLPPDWLDWGGAGAGCGMAAATLAAAASRSACHAVLNANRLHCDRQDARNADVSGVTFAAPHPEIRPAWKMQIHFLLRPFRHLHANSLYLLYVGHNCLALFDVSIIGRNWWGGSVVSRLSTQSHHRTFSIEVTEIRALFSGQLEPKRMVKIRERMLAAGLPMWAVIAVGASHACMECELVPSIASSFAGSVNMRAQSFAIHSSRNRCRMRAWPFSNANLPNSAGPAPAGGPGGKAVYNHAFETVQVRG
jgi:hypothetical protein